MVSLKICETDQSRGLIARNLWSTHASSEEKTGPHMCVAIVFVDPSIIIKQQYYIYL